MIIKNDEYLKEDTHIEDVPELVYERKEAEELKNRFNGYFFGTEPAFTRILSGTSGSGKTTSVLYILYNFVKQNPQFSKDFIYLDGTQIRTPKSMFNYISRQLGGNIEEGTISSLIEHITSSINKSGRKKLIIIDEVDKIYKNSRESPKYSFLHSLNRMDIKPKHSLLLITNDFNLTKNFGSELTSSMVETTFDSYTTDDILKILKLRAKYCIDPHTYNIDDLAIIAREVFQNPTGGDKANIRHGLNILSQAALLAQEQHKTISEVIKMAIERVRVDNYTKLLKKYNRHLIILIKSLCILKNKSSVGIYKFMNPDINYDDIKYTFFKLMEEEGMRLISESQFRKYIEQMVNENLLLRINRAKYSFLDDSDNILAAINVIF